jgi:hypothetical protein
MSPFFPHVTSTWHVHEPTALRRLLQSVVATAVITGVVVRLLRMLALTRGQEENWMYIVGLLALAVVVFFGMATLHLGNYTLRRWLWRVPAFALIETGAEMATSALLIAAGLEPLGTDRAHFHDWPALATRTGLERLAGLVVFALVLAGVVQLVRVVMMKGEGRHTPSR